MKRVPLKLLAVLFILGVMLAMPKAAEAHNVSGAKYQASSHDNYVPAAPATAGEQEHYVVAFTNNTQDDDCGSGCCSMTAACCSPASIGQEVFEFQPYPASFVFEIGSQVLPQGPPYSLLRPPKHSA